MSHSRYPYLFASVPLASTLPLSELPARADGLPTRYFVHEVAQPLFGSDKDIDWRHEWFDPAGNATLTGTRVANTCFLHFPGICEARLGSDGSVAVWREPSSSIESLRHALIDQILPRLLAHNGHLMLHGGAVVTGDDACVVLIGDSGRGKSTLSAALATNGGRLLTDDCLRIDFTEDAVHAIASYPGLRLLPDSLAALYGAQAPATSAVAHYTAKRRLTHEATAPAQPTPPIAAIFVLQPPSTDAQIHVEALPPQQACIELVRNAFQLDLGDMAHMRAQLALAARVTSDVPVFTLAYPRDYARLREVVAHIRTLTCDMSTTQAT